MQLSKLDKINIFASELLAKSILEMYHAVKLGERSVSEIGFRYSFKLPDNTKISSNDFKSIKKFIQKNIDRALNVSYEKISKTEAKKIFADNKYKLVEIKNTAGKLIEIIRIGKDFVDICPDLELKKISKSDFIELTNVSGQYFNSDAGNEQLIAIEGWARDNVNDFKEYKKFLVEKNERDHRKIGADLELFCFDSRIGQGLPIWLENGTNIKFEIENFCKELLCENEYKFVQTPVLGTIELYKISGHWNHYRENMFTPLKVDDEEFVLKPMSCPHHIVTYQQKPHSYRELPYRIAEFGIQHRYEASGALTGLERVRQMQLVDTHTILMHSQINSEIKRVYNLIVKAHKVLGTSIYSVELSLRDPKNKEKFFDNDEMWESAENQLRAALKSLKIPYKEVIGEAAFYGPKIDMQIKTVLGHIITVSTIQLDFLLPERFKLEYIGSSGEKEVPVFIHAGIIGTFERYLAILLEQTKGVLPLWLSPIQVIFIPVSDKQYDFARKLQLMMIKDQIRARIDNSDERLSKKIREAQIKKIPYQVVIGDKEVENNTVTYRQYGKSDEITVPFNKFLKLLKKQIQNKK